MRRKRKKQKEENTKGKKKKTVRLEATGGTDTDAEAIPGSVPLLSLDEALGEKGGEGGALGRSRSSSWDSRTDTQREADELAAKLAAEEAARLAALRPPTPESVVEEPSESEESEEEEVKALSVAPSTVSTEELKPDSDKLLEAAKNGDQETLDALLEVGTDWDSSDGMVRTASLLVCLPLPTRFYLFFWRVFLVVGASVSFSPGNTHAHIDVPSQPHSRFCL